MILSVDILKGHQGEPQALANLKGARFSTARAKWPGGAREGPLTAHSSRCPFNQPELTAAPFRSLPRAAARFQRSIRPREYSEIDAAEKSIPRSGTPDQLRAIRGSQLRSRQRLKQLSRRNHIRCSKAFGEPIVDRCEDLSCLAVAPLGHPQTG